jgi:hypothetical protein
MFRPPNKWWLFSLAVVGVSFLAYAVFKQQAWEAWREMLDGPFYGTNYLGNASGEPVSSLPVPSGGSLRVHWSPDTHQFTITHQLATSNVWSRVLLAERITSEGSVRRTEIREFELRSLRRTREGYEVLFSGEWFPGGREKGLLLLGPDLSFRAFYLDW